MLASGIAMGNKIGFAPRKVPVTVKLEEVEARKERQRFYKNLFLNSLMCSGVSGQGRFPWTGYPQAEF